MSDFPEHVDQDERPEPTPENIPDDVLEAAIGTAVDYSGCPFCGERQFHVIVPGHNSYHECVECGETFDVVG